MKRLQIALVWTALCIFRITPVALHNIIGSVVGTIYLRLEQ